MTFLGKVCFTAAGTLLLVGVTSGPSQAKTKVQGNIVPQNIGGDCGGGSDPCYNLPTDKFGKFAVKESNKAGTAGIEMQLKVKGVDCPEVDVGGDAGKCNDTNHVLEVNSDFGGLETKVGLLYDLVKGKSGFQASGGKNKVSGTQAFGPLAGAAQGNTLGIGFMRVRAQGSNPAICLNAPLFPGNACTNGEIYGIGGIIANDEPGTEPPPCTSDAECAPSQDCTLGNCVSEPCTQDSDCDEFGGGEVACNEVTMLCCLVNLDTNPDCDVD